MGRGSYFMVVYSVVLGIIVGCGAAQTVHVVGDGFGWDIPPNSSVSYTNWASGKTFIVGDILEFNFVTNQHDVLRVPPASYDACTQDNAIGNIITTGPVNITLDSPGDHRFICTVGPHCQLGQKLAITVVSSTPGGANPPMTTPPTTPTTPSPASPQPDASAPTPNPGSPTAVLAPPAGFIPDSASTSLACSFFFILLSAAVAVIF